VLHSSGRLLALTNIRTPLKNLPGTNTLAQLCRRDEEKKGFVTLTPDRLGRATSGTGKSGTPRHL
jgi:hypothetical protein